MEANRLPGFTRVVTNGGGTRSYMPGVLHHDRGCIDNGRITSRPATLAERRASDACETCIIRLARLVAALDAPV
jgi:hypothetical protein